MCSCAAQPQCSMKESPAALLLRHDVDRLDWASSASNNNGSLAPLLTLHTLVGATICGAQTDAAAQVERVARRNRRFHARTRTPHEGARVKVAVSCAAGPAQRRCIRVRRYKGPYPVQCFHIMVFVLRVLAFAKCNRVYSRFAVPCR